MFEAIRNVISNVVEFFKRVWNVAFAVVRGYFNVYKAVFTAVFNALRTVVSGVVNFFRTAWNTAVSFVSGVIRRISGVVSSVFSAVRSTIQGVIDFFRNSWDRAVNFVSGIFERVGSTISNIMSGIRNAIETAVSFGKGVINGLIDSVNRVINLINRVPGVNVSPITTLSAGIPAGAIPVPTAAVSPVQITRIAVDGRELSYVVERSMEQRRASQSLQTLMAGVA